MLDAYSATLLFYIARLLALLGNFNSNTHDSNETDYLCFLPDAGAHFMWRR